MSPFKFMEFSTKNLKLINQLKSFLESRIWAVIYFHFRLKKRFLALILKIFVKKYRMSFTKNREFSPIADAILTLIDRITITNQKKKLLSILEILAKRNRSSEIFHLMRPSVLPLLFKLLRQNDEENHYDLRQAILEIRYSSSNKEIIKSYLVDSNKLIQETAVKIHGKWKVPDFAEDLVSLLKNENDRELNREIYVALGAIGPKAVPPLLEILDNENSTSAILRRVSYALRNIGHRNERISKATAKIIEKAIKLKDDELLTDFLLTAAHLRNMLKLHWQLLPYKAKT